MTRALGNNNKNIKMTKKGNARTEEVITCSIKDFGGVKVQAENDPVEKGNYY